MYVSPVSSNLFIMNSIKIQQTALQRSVERLASGKRINRAADSPGELLRMAKAEARVKTGYAAQRNIQDGINYLNTASESTFQMTSMAQRLKELSVQYQNSSLTDSDKSAIRDEAKALGAEIAHAMKNTKFNGINVFEHNLSLQTGSELSSTFNAAAPKLTVSKSLPSQAAEAATTLMEASLHVQKRTVNTETTTLLSALSISEPQAQAIESAPVTTSLLAQETTAIVPEYKATFTTASLDELKGRNGYVRLLDEFGNLKYEGNVTDGQFNGYGRYFVNGQVKYEGDWNNGVVNGFGAIYQDNGSLEYRGTTVNGVYNGYGTVYGENGKTVYQGDLKEGFRQGWGTTYDTSGNWIESKTYTAYDAALEQAAQGGNGGSGTYPGEGSGGVDNPPTGGVDNPPTGGVDNPPTGGVDNPPTGGVDNPPTGGVNNPPTGGVDNPPTGGIDNPPTGGVDNPPTGGIDNPPTGGVDNPPTGGVDDPANDNDISLADLDQMDAKDLLNSDFADSLISTLANANVSYGIAVSVMERRLELQSSQVALNETSLSHIRDADIARETIERTKQEILLQSSLTLLMHNLDQHRSFITELLRM